MKDETNFHYKKYTIEYEPVDTATQSSINVILVSGMIRDVVRQELIKFIQNDFLEW